LTRASRGALSLALLLAIGARASAEEAPAPAPPEPITLRVMTFNVEYGGTGVDFGKVVEALERARPDVVGLEEPEGNAPALAEALGWRYVDRRSDVISRLPILDPPGAEGRFVLVEVRPGEVVALANVHLPSDPYGPHWVAEGRPLDAVLALERRLRLSKLEPALDALRRLRGVPAFLVGDFNAPSRRDWTLASVGQRAHLRSPVEWPVSVAVEEAGFVDSYRAVHRDPVQRPGLTWWAARPPVGDDFSRDPQDRIDFVYAAGPAQALHSELVGEPGARDVDLSVEPWPSDHRAVVSTFRVTPAPMPPLVAVNGNRLVTVGDPLPVEIHNPGGVGRRVAIAPADPSAARLEPSRIAAASPVRAGRGAVRLPTRELAPGRYEVVLLAPGDEVLSRIPFSVKAPGDAAQVAVDRAVYRPGEAIRVRWSGGPGNRWDWIGVFAAAVEPTTGSQRAWRHTGTRIDGQLVIDGSAPEDERWPLEPGDYQVLYLLHDAFEPVASVRFAVRGDADREAGPPRASGVVRSAAPYRPDSGSLAVRCGRLVDGLADGVREAVTVRIEQGRIAAVGEDVEPAAAAPVLDLPRYTCLPGLIDMHTHLSDRPGDTADLRVYLRRTLEEQVAIGRENARVTLLAGFTTVRDVGTYVAWSDRALRDEILRGEIIGPRMQVSGFYLTVPGGGGDLLIPGIPESQVPALVRTGVARGPQAFRRRAELAVAGGADLLKVIASGAVLAYGGVPGAPEMTPQEIRAVVEVAHAAGRKVAAHAHGARSIKEAILAGVDTIEHASLIDDEAIALAREHRVALSMDVYNGSYIDSEGRRQRWPEEFLRKNLETTDAQRRGFARAHRAGAPIVYGTDAAVYPHGWNAKQFEVMIGLGMSPMQAIQSATSLAASAMGWADRVGAIATGRYGDLIAVEGDPLADPHALQRVAVVIQGGLVFKLPAE
jgi:imidazolonepropionase-like amidohydrolase/endonuclease/exonuclease/phosphatase family metal-dependent hydrolase